MVYFSFPTFKNGIDKIRNNPQLVYTILVAFVITGAFVVMSERFIGGQWRRAPGDRLPRRAVHRGREAARQRATGREKGLFGRGAQDDGPAPRVRPTDQS